MTEEEKKKNKSKEKVTFSSLISILALVISIASIYFSVFYKYHEMTANVFFGDINKLDNTIELDVLYHNQGNTYGTIIKNYLTFYQNSDWENKGITLNNNKQVYYIPNNPIVLPPGKQQLNEIRQEVNFNDSILIDKDLIDFNNTIKVGLVIEFINDFGLLSRELFYVGDIKLNENRNIEKYDFKYSVFELYGDTFISGSNN